MFSGSFLEKIAETPADLGVDLQSLRQFSTSRNRRKRDVFVTETVPMGPSATTRNEHTVPIHLFLPIRRSQGLSGVHRVVAIHIVQDS